MDPSLIFTPGGNAQQLVTVAAPSALGLQSRVRRAIAEVAALNPLLSVVGFNIAAAGDGGLFVATLAVTLWPDQGNAPQAGSDFDLRHFQAFGRASVPGGVKTTGTVLATATANVAVDPAVSSILATYTVPYSGIDGAAADGTIHFEVGPAGGPWVATDDGKSIAFAFAGGAPLAHTLNGSLSANAVGGGPTVQEVRIVYTGPDITTIDNTHLWLEVATLTEIPQPVPIGSASAWFVESDGSNDEGVDVSNVIVSPAAASPQLGLLLQAAIQADLDAVPAQARVPFTSMAGANAGRRFVMGALGQTEALIVV